MAERGGNADIRRDGSRGKTARPRGPAPLGDCIGNNGCVIVSPMRMDIHSNRQIERMTRAHCTDACDALANIGEPRGPIGDVAPPDVPRARAGNAPP